MVVKHLYEGMRSILMAVTPRTILILVQLRLIKDVALSGPSILITSNAQHKEEALDADSPFSDVSRHFHHMVTRLTTVTNVCHHLNISLAPMSKAFV